MSDSVFQKPRLVPRKIALTLIGLYRRFISPFKGFRCAYSYHTGRASCSDLGLRAIRMHGLRRGTAIVRRRLRECSVKHREHLGERPRLHPQAGFCDAFDADCGDCACDAIDGCELPDACGDWKKKKRDKGSSD